MFGVRITWLLPKISNDVMSNLCESEFTIRPCQRQLNHALLALKSLLIVFSIICYLNADDIFFPIFTLSSVHQNKSFLLLSRFMWMRLHIPWSVWKDVRRKYYNIAHVLITLYTSTVYICWFSCMHPLYSCVRNVSLANAFTAES